MISVVINYYWEGSGTLYHEFLFCRTPLVEKRIDGGSSLLGMQGRSYTFAVKIHTRRDYFVPSGSGRFSLRIFVLSKNNNQ